MKHLYKGRCCPGDSVVSLPLEIVHRDRFSFMSVLMMMIQKLMIWWTV